MKYLLLLKDIAEDNKIYIVGGALRNYLLDKEIKDIDLVVMSNLTKIIDGFSALTDKNKIVLDQKRSIYRIVTEENKFIDFTPPVSQDLFVDLGCRDFTINSMAVDLKDVGFLDNEILIEYEDIIDPYEGKADLDNKIIRMVSEEFVTEDPLRILRAYRFCNNLDFSIEKKTLKLIENNTNLLAEVANERIKEELFLLYSSYLKPNRLAVILQSNILSVLFNIKINQNDKLIKKVLNQFHNIRENNYLKKTEIENYIFNLIAFFMWPIYQNKISVKQLLDKLLSYTFNKKGIRLLKEYLIIIKKIIRDYKSYKNNDILVYEELFKDNIDISTLKYLLLSFFQSGKNSIEQESVFEILNILNKMKERTSYKLIDGNDVKEVLEIKESRVIGRILKEVNKKQALGVLKEKAQVIRYLRERY